MKKLFVFVCSFFLFYNSTRAQQASDTALSNATGPKMTFVNNDTSYDFGGIPVGTVIENQFEIRNTGDAPLIITGMKCESGNLQCKWPGKSIKPGKKGMLTVTYTAHGDNGSFKNDIYITSNATASPYPFLHVTGAITPVGGSYAPSSMGNKNGKGGRKGP